MCVMIVVLWLFVFLLLMVVVTLFCVDITMIPDNNIGDEGVKALVPALKSLSQLTRLDLHGEY